MLRDRGHPGLMPWVVRKVRAGPPRAPRTRRRPCRGELYLNAAAAAELVTEDIDEGVLVAAHLMQIYAFEADRGAFGEKCRVLVQIGGDVDGPA
jgi:hypothetical protein